MRVVLDTNILVSALMIQTSTPAAVYRAWEEGRFKLLTCTEQLEELREALHKPAIAGRIKAHEAGRLFNQIRRLAEIVRPLPHVERSPDPADNFVLALSEAGEAHYLVTGDKSGLLALGRHRGARILTAREFAALLARGPTGRRG